MEPCKSPEKPAREDERAHAVGARKARSLAEGDARIEAERRGLGAGREGDRLLRVDQSRRTDRRARAPDAGASRGSDGSAGPAERIGLAELDERERVFDAALDAGVAEDRSCS